MTIKQAGSLLVDIRSCIHPRMNCMLQYGNLRKTDTNFIHCPKQSRILIISEAVTSWHVSYYRIQRKCLCTHDKESTAMADIALPRQQKAALAWTSLGKSRRKAAQSLPLHYNTAVETQHGQTITKEERKAQHMALTTQNSDTTG